MASPVLCHQEGSNSMSWMGVPRSNHYQPLTPTKPKNQYGAYSSSLEVGNFSTGKQVSTSAFSKGSLPVSKSDQQHNGPKKYQFVLTGYDTHNAEMLSHTLSKKILSDTKENKHRSPKKEQNAAWCYVCNNTVLISQHKKFTQHLFFGSTQCVKCGLKCEDCLTFKLLNSCVNADCDHSLEFTQDAYSFLISKFLGKLGNKSENSLVLDFLKNIKSLHIIANIPPWRPVIEMCAKYIITASVELKKALSVRSERIKASTKHKKSQTNCNVSNTNFCDNANDDVDPDLHRDTQINGINASELILSQTYDLNVLDQEVEYVAVQNGNTQCHDILSLPSEAPQPSKKQKTVKSKLRSLIKMPEDGNYLVLREAIEECPMCYTELCPSRFQVDVVSFLITTVCTGCDLTIYFVVSPSVSVVTCGKAGRPPKKKHVKKQLKARAVHTSKKKHEGTSSLQSTSQ